MGTDQFNGHRLKVAIVMKVETPVLSLGDHLHGHLEGLGQWLAASWYKSISMF